MKKGFTLIELILVVAILAILATLAVGKFAGLKQDAQEKTNFANLKRVGAAVEAYLAANSMENTRTSSIFNRLDSLTMDDADTAGAGTTSQLGHVRNQLMCYSNQTENVGLSSAIASEGSSNPYAGEQLGVLGVYYLTAADAQALSDYGLKYVMRGYPERNPPTSVYTFHGDDEAWVQGDPNNADTCACVARTNAIGMAVAVVNPAASVNRVPAGPDIYRSCGEEVVYSATTYKVRVNGVDASNNEDAFKKLLAGEGVLLAFGLGEKCALVGNEKGGLDSAPVSPIMKKDEYRRYILLFRLRHTAQAYGTTSRVEFAGVMDPKGRTLSMLRAEVK